MRQIQSVDDVLEPSTHKLVEHMRGIDINYGSQTHQLMFVERMDEAQRRAPCPGGKITCGDGWHTTGSKLGANGPVSCYDAKVLYEIATDQMRLRAVAGLARGKEEQRRSK